jgi:hypothetical protein
VFKCEESEESLKKLTGKDYVVNPALRMTYVCLMDFLFPTAPHVLLVFPFPFSYTEPSCSYVPSTRQE